MLTAGITAGAYYFPQPDWGALLNERTDMATETDFELYAEAHVSTAPYYGAKFEPSAGAYIGMVAENAAPYEPLGSYLTYIQDMGQNDLYYPANTMISGDNVISMIGWTIYDMNNVDYDQIRRVLETLNNYNKPMLIRFANEMNCSSLGNEPDVYISVFRNVANMIHEYPNFGVVWSPNDIGALDRPFEYYYPGDEYVDWVGVSSYMTKYFRNDKNTAYKDSIYFMTGDYSWPTNRIKPLMEFMRDNNIQKPVMISEGGIARYNGYGDDYTGWNEPRMRNMMWYLTMKYPQIKMINYFNSRHDSNEDSSEQYDITDYASSSAIFREAAESGAYIRSYGGSPEFVFQKANDAGTIVSNGGIVSLYTLAYFDKRPDITVNYTVDGQWYHSSDTIPYTCNMDISGMQDGAHTLMISSNGKSNSYTFYKSGKCIRFGQQPEPSVVAEAEDAIEVKINGSALSFDRQPVIIDGRTLVPMRAIFEALGAEVEWNGSTLAVTARKDGVVISLKINDNKMTVGDKTVTLDVAAQLINDRTMVPVRAISEAFGCVTEWNDSDRTVNITV